MVGVWRSDWLAPSETFIRDQMISMNKWRPLPIGLRRVPNGIVIDNVMAPFTRKFSSRVGHRLSASTNYRVPYDAYLRQNRVELIHSHFGPGAIRVLEMARRNSIPLISTFHGFDVTSEPAGASRRARHYRSRLKNVFDYASRLLAVSDFVAARLLELGAPEEKIEKHNIGIPIHDSENKFGIPSECREGIIFVGRLIAQKGPQQVLAAVKSLPNDLKNVPVTLVGSGPLKDRLVEQTRASGLNVRFTGTLSSEGVAAELAKHAVFCGASSAFEGRVEAFGIVYLEAALQGLPVVAYASGGVGEAVSDGETGFLVPEGDVAALAERLASVLHDRRLGTALGRAGYERVVRRFDIRDCTRGLERIYDAVTEEGSPMRRG